MTVNIDVDLQGWRDDIADMKKDLKAVNDEKFKLEAEVDDAKEEIGELRSEVEFLTEGAHEIEVETNIDRDSIKRSLNGISEELDDIDDLDLDLGDFDDLDDINVSIDAEDFDAEIADALDDIETDKTITISSELDDDEEDGGILGRLLDDDEELTESGTVKWSSRGGRAGGHARGTIEWDSDINGTDFRQELKKAKAEAKAVGATEIEWDIDRDSLDIDWGEIADLDDDDGVEIEIGAELDPDAERFLEKLPEQTQGNTSRTHRYTEVTNYEARADWGSYEEAEKQVEKLKRKVNDDDELIRFRPRLETDQFEEDLGMMLGDLDAMDTEMEVEVCVERCDNWKENLNRIHTDLNAIKNWDGDDDGDVDVQLKGTRAEINEAVDRMEDSGMETDGGGTSNGSPAWGPPAEGWTREDRQWMSGRSSVVTESEGQQRRLSDVLNRLGVSGDTSGDRFSVDDIEVSADDLKAEVRRVYGDDLADSQAWHTKKPEVRERATQRKYAEVVHGMDRGGTHDWPDKDHRSEFDIPEWWGMSDLDLESGSGHPMSNVMDKEFAENPLDDTKTKKFWNRIFSNTAFEMPDTGFFDRDRKRGPGSAFIQAMQGGSMFSLAGMSSGLGNFFDSEAFEEATEAATSFKSKLSSLIPTMHKWYQLLALAIPVLATMAVQALGAASAMAAMAAAGAAVTGLGLLGFGDDMGDSLEEAKTRLKDLAEDLFGAAQPMLEEFSMFTEQLLVTLPMKLQPLIESMSGLTTFMDNGMLDGLIGWMTDVTDAIVAFEPIIEQLGNRFGSLLGEGIIDFFEWLVLEAYKNQEMFIMLSAAVKDALLALYNVFVVASKLIVVFSPLLDILRRFTALLNNEWIVGIMASIAAMWGLYAVMVKVGLAMKALWALGKAGIFWNLATSAAKSIKPLVTLAGWLAKVIGLKATALGMTIGGLALVTAGLAAGYKAYQAVKPKGTPTSFSKGSVSGATGGGASGGGFDGPGTSGGGSFSNNGGGGTVINVEGDITRDSLPDVENAIERAEERKNTRNPD